FEVVTNHVSLSYLKTMRFSGNNRQTRWALFLQSYRFSVRYKKGILNTAADAISNGEPPTETAVDDAQDSDLDANWTEYVPTAAVGSEQRREVLVPVEVSNATRVERINIEFADSDDETGYAAPIAAITQLPMIDDVREALRHCPDFAPLLDYLQHGKLPAMDDAARKVVTQSPDYEVENGVLYLMYAPRTRNINRARAVIKQLCVPTALREAVAVGLHDINCHPGFDRVYATARSRYFFQGMYTFLKAHVLTCKECQVCKRVVGVPKVPITSLPVPIPCTRWHLDFHGSFPESSGFKYILCMIDSTSMWPELIATKDCTAETVASAIFDNIVARFGLPRGISVLTDNGSAFISMLAKAFCKAFNIKQFFTSPHHPQTNVRAEEFADTIHKSLRILCKDQADWSKHLQAIAMAYRATATTNTGLSPHDVIFGTPMPIALDWGILVEDSTTPSANAYMADIRPKIQVFREIAIENARDSEKPVF